MASVVLFMRISAALGAVSTKSLFKRRSAPCTAFNAFNCFQLGRAPRSVRRTERLTAPGGFLKGALHLRPAIENALHTGAPPVSLHQRLLVDTAPEGSG